MKKVIYVPLLIKYRHINERYIQSGYVASRVIVIGTVACDIGFIGLL